MKLMLKNYNLAFAIVLTTFFCSCGGGGGGGGGSAPIVIDIVPSPDAFQPSVLPALSGSYYQYKNGNQQFLAQNIETLKAKG